jgi:hypothetical protein
MGGREVSARRALKSKRERHKESVWRAGRSTVGRQQEESKKEEFGTFILGFQPDLLQSQQLPCLLILGLVHHTLWQPHCQPSPP